MRSKLFFFVGVFFLYSLQVSALEKNTASINSTIPETLMTDVPGAEIVGQGVLSYAFWDVYKATLFAADGVWMQNKPFALSLEYYRTIKGKDIADRSVQEIRQQGFTNEVALAAWNSQMKAIFPDVKNGTVLTAIYLPGKQTTFYQGTDSIGAIKGDEFGTLFFGIWLAEKTSEPQLRRALLGLQ